MRRWAVTLALGPRVAAAAAVPQAGLPGRFSGSGGRSPRTEDLLQISTTCRTDRAYYRFWRRAAAPWPGLLELARHPRPDHMVILREKDSGWGACGRGSPRQFHQPAAVDGGLVPKKLDGVGSLPMFEARRGASAKPDRRLPRTAMTPPARPKQAVGGVASHRVPS